MLENIFLAYSQFNPIGVWEHSLMSNVKLYPDDDRNRTYVSKAIQFLFKKDKDGVRRCDVVRFDLKDGHSLLCEVRGYGDLPSWENHDIIQVTELDGGYEVTTYRVDKSTLRKQLMKELPHV